MGSERDRDTDGWQSAIDRQIRQAEERGVFDNLPGKGRPLNIDSNPHAGDQEMAYKILKDAGFAPEWIELDKEIRTRLDRARQVLARHWERRQALGQDAAGQPGARGEAAWQSAVTAFEQEVAALNREIAILNLKVPASQFQRLSIDARREVERVQAAADDQQAAADDQQAAG